MTSQWTKIGHLFANEDLRPGVSEDRLAETMDRLPCRLPEDYQEFLRLTDGYYGPLGGDGLICLHPLATVVSLARQGGFPETAPGFMQIGTDGGGTLYGIVSDPPGVRYVQVYSDDISQVMELGRSFAEFLDRALHEQLQVK